MAQTTRANHDAIGALGGFGAIPMTPGLLSALGGFGAIPMTPGLLSALDGIAKMDMPSGILSALDGIAKMDMPSGILSALDGIAKMDMPSGILSALDGTGLLAKARADVFGSMSMQLSALGRPPQWWSSMIADNLSITSRVAADVAAITDAFAIASPPARSSLRGLQLGVTQVVGAHHRHLESTLAGLLGEPANPGAGGRVVTPTSTTAAFTGVARGIALPMPMVRDTTDQLAEPVEELARRLDALDSHAAARDLRAAWDVLRRRHPGWPKSGAHLLREVIREAINELAPPAQVPADSKGFVTKRAQVTWIVGGDHEFAVLVDVMAGNVGRLHSLLSAEAKNSGWPRVGHQGLVGLLEVVMGLIRIMVEQISNRRSD